MLINLLPLAALALLSAVVVAHPTNGQDAKEVDFHMFPEFAALGSLEELSEGEALESGTNVDSEGIEARAANQCTLAKLKQILFDYSEC